MIKFPPHPKKISLFLATTKTSENHHKYVENKCWADQSEGLRVAFSEIGGREGGYSHV